MASGTRTADSAGDSKCDDSLQRALLSRQRVALVRTLLGDCVGTYQAALKHPNIEVSTNNTNRTYTAVPVDGEEHDRVMADYNMGFLLRFLCGFAPSKLLRLEPDEP